MCCCFCVVGVGSREHTTLCSTPLWRSVSACCWSGMKPCWQCSAIIAALRDRYKSHFVEENWINPWWGCSEAQEPDVEEVPRCAEGSGPWAVQLVYLCCLQSLIRCWLHFIQSFVWTLKFFQNKTHTSGLSSRPENMGGWGVFWHWPFPFHQVTSGGLAVHLSRDQEVWLETKDYRAMTGKPSGYSIFSGFLLRPNWPERRHADHKSDPSAWIHDWVESSSAINWYKWMFLENNSIDCFRF